MFPFKSIDVSRKGYADVAFGKFYAQHLSSNSHGSTKLLSTIYANVFAIFKVPGLIFDYIGFGLRVIASWLWFLFKMSLLWLAFITVLFLVWTITSHKYADVDISAYQLLFNIYCIGAIPATVLFTIFAWADFVGSHGKDHALYHMFSKHRKIQFFIPRALIFGKEYSFENTVTHEKELVFVPYIYKISIPQVRAILEDNYSDIIRMNINTTTLIQYLFLTGQIREVPAVKETTSSVDEMDLNATELQINLAPDVTLKDEISSQYRKVLKKLGLFQLQVLLLGVTEDDRVSYKAELSEGLKENSLEDFFNRNKLGKTPSLFTKAVMKKKY